MLITANNVGMCILLAPVKRKKQAADCWSSANLYHSHNSLMSLTALQLISHAHSAFGTFKRSTSCITNGIGSPTINNFENVTLFLSGGHWLLGPILRWAICCQLHQQFPCRLTASLAAGLSRYAAYEANLIQAHIKQKWLLIAIKPFY